jgi:hypothetical protein
MNNNDRNESRTSLFSCWLADLYQRAECELGVSAAELSEKDLYDAFEEQHMTVSEVLKYIRQEYQERQS